MNNPFQSLKHPNFRYYWIGMCISLIGTWMQNVAQPWMAYKLTASPFLLSLIGAMQFMPMLLFSLFAGVLMDRYSKKKILLLTQTISMLIALTLAILTWTNLIAYWHILLMATLLGIVSTLDMPTRQAFIIEMVGREDLTNAIAMNSMAFNVARMIGPAIAGVIMGWLGIGACFFINGISFLAVLIGLFFIKPITTSKQTQASLDVIGQIKDGLLYIKNTPILIHTLLLVAIIGTFGPNYNVLVPVFATEVLHLNESGFGLLMSFLGIGSFSGAMLVASSGNEGPNRLFRLIFPWIFGVCLFLLGFSPTFIAMGLGLMICGFFFVSFSSTSNSTMQLNTTDNYRSRVMSVYTLIFAGSTPFGNLYVGTISEYFGARVGFYASGGIIIVLMALLYLSRKPKKTQN